MERARRQRQVRSDEESWPSPGSTPEQPLRASVHGPRVVSCSAGRIRPVCPDGQVSPWARLDHLGTREHRPGAAVTATGLRARPVPRSEGGATTLRVAAARAPRVERLERSLMAAGGRPRAAVKDTHAQRHEREPARCVTAPPDPRLAATLHAGCSRNATGTGEGHGRPGGEGPQSAKEAAACQGHHGWNGEPENGHQAAKRQRQAAPSTGDLRSLSGGAGVVRHRGEPEALPAGRGHWSTSAGTWMNPAKKYRRQTRAPQHVGCRGAHVASRISRCRGCCRGCRTWPGRARACSRW
jgi:hypothetical protein